MPYDRQNRSINAGSQSIQDLEDDLASHAGGHAGYDINNTPQSQSRDWGMDGQFGCDPVNTESQQLTDMEYEGDRQPDDIETVGEWMRFNSRTAR